MKTRVRRRPLWAESWAPFPRNNYYREGSKTKCWCPKKRFLHCEQNSFSPGVVHKKGKPLRIRSPIANKGGSPRELQRSGGLTEATNKLDAK